MSFDFDSEEIGERFAEAEKRIDRLEYSRKVHAWSLVVLCLCVLAVISMVHR